MQSYLLLGATFAFAAVVQPGQFQAYLLAQAIRHGWRRTLPAALAPVLSDIPVIALVLLVLTQIPPVLVHLLQLAGGGFLLYLAYGALQACRQPQPDLEQVPVRAHQTLLRAALVNLLNPNPYLAWALIMGPLLLQAWRQHPAHGVGLVIAFYTTMVLGTAGIIILFAQARALGPRIARGLVAVSAVALAGFGLFQLWSGAAALRRLLA
jgi:threonine/homoserine/homoserine lactone efflux protein